MKASIIIPTHDRPHKLEVVVNCLRHQDTSTDDYEIIVVDDNSVPPVALKAMEGGPRTSLVRLVETERSAARNTGAARARGEILVFVDDDMKVGSDFVSCHLRAHDRFPGSLVVGSVRLPQEALATPFGRFRQKLEDNALPVSSGPTPIQNFCTAANMSVAREVFLELGGFDSSIISGEDQDFALRHSARGGKIVFLPEAAAIHCDDSLDIQSYCRRAEWGSRHMIPFCLRYPDRTENKERQRINGPMQFGGEPLTQTLRKAIKSVLGFKPVQAILFAVTALLDRSAPDSAALDRTYRLLLGAHIFRGYREGLRRSTAIDQLPDVEMKATKGSYVGANR